MGIPVEKFSMESVPEEERIWVRLMLKTTAQCGRDSEKIFKNVRAVVEGTLIWLFLRRNTFTNYFFEI